MKRLLIGAMIFLAVFLSVGLGIAKIEVPSRTSRWVNDYAGIIDNATKDELEKLASSVKQKTPDPVELIIATFATTGGWNFEDFVLAYGERWREAKRGKRDNGVVLIVVMDERRVSIGVGNNLKGILTNQKTAEIINNLILPEFKKGRYSDGMEKGAEEIVAVLNSSKIPQGTILSPIITILIIAAILLYLIFRREHKA